MNVEIWSDLVCPWCYIGQARFRRALDEFAHRDEVQVRYRSFELDPAFPPGETVDVQDMLSAAVDGGAAVLVADGSRTTFCGCSGVTALLLAHHRAAAAGAQLRLVSAAPLVRRILAVTGADQELDIYPDRAAALGGRQRRPAFPAGSTQAGRPIIPVPAP